jgi:molybdopterin converting factor small subunit
MIDVHLYGKLRRFSGDSDPRRESVLPMDVREGETISDIIRRIGIPSEELGRNIFLNGEVSALERTVKDGDRLGIFPDDMQLLYRQYFPKKGGDEG